MTKDELSAALVLASKIQRLQASLADLRAGGVRATGTTAPVQGGPGAIHPGQLAVEIEERISSLTREWEGERDFIRRCILRLNILSELEEQVMLLRYVECRAWKAVAKATGYTYDRLKQINQECLGKITQRYP